uniref:kinesin-like protein KIF28P isoform X1 n=1 Tax=Styela clava TaxID=7725 RepID=UPI00193A8553|nr:kinesin-like protein KIF28P isoform X1 [Styela clava]
MPGENVKVAVRVRPFNQREIDANSKCVIQMDGGSTTITNPHTGEKKTFTFDHSYWSHDGYNERSDSMLVPENETSVYADQQCVFNQLGRQVLDNAWEGYNSTLFAYGQTGSGKSYSMLGYGTNKGIVPIACGELFKAIDSADKSNGKQMQVTFSMLEIYNEHVRDLLTNNTKAIPGGLKVRQDRNQSFYVPDLKQLPCRDYKAIERLMEQGTINRTTASTNMNATSSRSHMVITIKFKQVFNNDRGESTTKTSEINLVDLAGSERAKSTGATGDRLREGSAINVSLLTLSSVIEALAEGNPKKTIPYRSSVLTKLLKSALGGNSKTVMIAALSPADINYEETLSTLRYADRAKKIQNKAVINLSPTEKLIHDLKSENARLLQLLASHTSGGSSGMTHDKDFITADLEHLIAQNEKQMKESTMSWEQKLEDAKREWEMEHVSASDKMFSKNPYFQNVNEDPQLSGVIKKFIYEGVTMVGKCNNIDTTKKPHIALRGLGIQDHHANIMCNKSNVYADPISPNEVFVNGVKISKKTALKHGDRIKMGSNSLFLFVGFPNERKKSDDDLTKKYDYNFFQNELAASLGINYDLKSKQKDASGDLGIAEVYHDYLTLMPMVAEVNAISEELQKNVSFSLFVLNLASYDSSGLEKEKEVAVKVVQQITNQVWIWSKAKFTNRKYLIEELYNNFTENPESVNDIAHEDDPFWDPVEDVYLGCAHAWLHSLAYCMPLDDQIAILNHSGKEEGHLQVSVSPCTANGIVQSDEMMILDPNDLLNKRFDIMIQIQQCIGLKWIKQNSTRGIMIKFKLYDERYGHQTRALWHVVNPRVNFQQHITVDNVDDDFLTYLHSNAVVFEVWGLQGGRVDTPDTTLDDGMIRTNSPPHSSPPSTAASFSSAEFDAMEKELEGAKHEIKSLSDQKEELFQLCRILRKENTNLKTKVKEAKKNNKNGITRPSRPKSASKSEIISKEVQNEKDKTPSSRSSSAASQGNNNVQAELGRALKRYFGDIKPIQSQMQYLLSSEMPPEPARSKHGSVKGDSYDRLRSFADVRQKDIDQLSEGFNKALLTLKSSVAATVRARKTEMQPNGSS